MNLLSVSTYQKWIRFGLLNLAILALLGTAMRYKIAFDFPFLQQKNLLHAHTHFAFHGWVCHILYCAMAIIVANALQNPQKLKKYHFLIITNIICAFGMLISFAINGYNPISVAFSTLTIVIAIAYAAFFIMDAKEFPPHHAGKPWAIAGLLFNVISSVGALYLAYMMISKNVNQQLYLGSVYYYLHFQYNGWFLFGTLSILFSNATLPLPNLKKYFYVLVVSSILTFGLSILWAKLPTPLYIITVIAAVAQLICWGHMIYTFLPIIKQSFRASNVKHMIPILMYTAGIALTLKFILQMVSVIPSLSNLVFGFRPIVIAYLHLVLLAGFSLFFVGYYFYNQTFRMSKLALIGIVGIFVGAVLNETILGIQGIGAFSYTPVPKVNEMLFGAALILFISATILTLSQTRKSN